MPLLTCQVVVHQQWQSTAATGNGTTNFMTSGPLKQTFLQQSVSTGIETELLSYNVNREGGIVSIIKNSYSLPVIVEEAYPGFF